MGPFFSIIIPVYNGEQCIGQCLDSIYAQGLLEDDFEVICVNDASTDNTSKVILEYGLSHKNLRLITHEKNRRQGAARNTGLRAAAGEYILYIDADDTFIPDALIQLKGELERNNELDMLKFNHVIVENGVIKECQTLSDSQEIMSGRDFIKRNSIPWAPWSCAYSRIYLEKNKFIFEENVLFEDADYVINCIRLAHRILYRNIFVYKYIANDFQTTKVGKNKKTIIDIFKESERIKKLYIDEKNIDNDVAKIINSHYEYRYSSVFIRFWWLLSYKDRKELLMQYRPIPPYKDKLICFIGKYPKLFLVGSVVLKPFLCLLRLVYRKIKRR